MYKTAGKLVHLGRPIDLVGRVIRCPRSRRKSKRNRELAVASKGAGQSTSRGSQDVGRPTMSTEAGLRPKPLIPLAAVWPATTPPDEAAVVAQASEPTTTKPINPSLALPESSTRPASNSGDFKATTTPPLVASEAWSKADFIICPVCKGWLKPRKFREHILSLHPSYANADWLAGSIRQTPFRSPRELASRPQIKTKKAERRSLDKTISRITQRKSEPIRTLKRFIKRQRTAASSAKRRSVQRAFSGAARRKPKRKTRRLLFHPGWS